MSAFSVKKTALFAAGSLVLLSGGMATTAQAMSTPAAKDKPICTPWEAGLAWAVEKPVGAGWVKGVSRMHPAVEHTEYTYERYVDGPQELSAWFKGVNGDPVVPANDPKDNPWVQVDNKQVTDAPTTWNWEATKPAVFETQVKWTKEGAEDRWIKEGDVLGGKWVKTTETREFETQQAVKDITNPSATYPTEKYPGYGPYTKILSSEKVYWHTEYQFGRLTKVKEESGWLKAMPAGSGWVQTDNHQVITEPAYLEFKWTREAKACVIKVDICHLKTLVPRRGDRSDGFVLKTVKIDSLEDAKAVDGHKFDAGDIIPEFDYNYMKPDKDGDDFTLKTFTFEGKNLSRANAAFLDNGCWLPPIVVPPIVVPPIVVPPIVVPPVVVPPVVVPPVVVPPVVTPVVTPAVVTPVVTPAAVTPAPVVAGVEAVKPAYAGAGVADTSGQLTAGGLAGLGALFAFGGGFLLRRKAVK